MRFSFRGLMLFGLFLAVTPAAFAATWYVNGVSGNDSNNCLSSTTACKTIGHAISLAASGDSVMVAAATYTENLAIGISLKVIGSGAKTTIIDGGGLNTVITIPNSSTNVILSRMTIRNGYTGAHAGGGIDNAGTVMLNQSIITGNRTCFGGGIYNSGTLTITNSTINGNSVSQQRYCDLAWLQPEQRWQLQLRRPRRYEQHQPYAGSPPEQRRPYGNDGPPLG